MLPGFVQCLVKLMQHVARRVAGMEGDDAQMGDGHAITLTSQAQVFQGGAELGGQARRLLGIEIRCQQAEFATAIARCQPGAPLRYLSQALEQVADRANQRIGALPAKALIEPGQIVELQHQQMTVAILLGDPQLIGQLFIEQSPVGQPCQAVPVGLAEQFFTARRLFGEQRLELLDHLVHRQHHAFQLRCARQSRQARELALADGFGLANHGVERA
ncbi:hypothetical protein D3C84_653010 [compost metagenome]